VTFSGSDVIRPPQNTWLGRVCGSEGIEGASVGTNENLILGFFGPNSILLRESRLNLVITMGVGCRFCTPRFVGFRDGTLEMAYSSSDKIEKNEMGVACSSYGGDERHIQDFGGKT
jgi:hypothetical protein